MHGRKTFYVGVVVNDSITFEMRVESDKDSTTEKDAIETVLHKCEGMFPYADVELDYCKTYDKDTLELDPDKRDWYYDGDGTKRRKTDGKPV